MADAVRRPFPSRHDPDLIAAFNPLTAIYVRLIHVTVNRIQRSAFVTEGVLNSYGDAVWILFLVTLKI